MKRTLHTTKFVTLGRLLAIPGVVAMAVGALMLTSCEHKDLCYMHSHTTRLKVVYDWRNAPEASPAGMCAFFYSTDRPGEYHRFDFPGAKSGYIELPAGNYSLISYNNDTEAVQFSSTNSYDSHTAFTRTGDILEPLYGTGVKSNLRDEDDERVVITPDELWGCASENINISEHGVTYTNSRADGDSSAAVEVSDSVITLYPTDKLCHYTYEVRNVKNISRISQISGALSGMSPSMNLSTDQLDDECVTLPVAGKVNTTDHTVTGSFLTFGHNEANTSTPHKMSFYVVMTDGSKYVYKDASNLDVTSQVNNAPDRRNVHIIIDGLDLPTPIDSDGGFKPSVDGWGIVNEDINV